MNTSISARRVVAATITAVLASACARADRPADTSAMAASGADSMHMTSPGAMATPTDQMKTVLDQLAALGGKPIETLSAPEARKQPTPADAVKKVLTMQGKPATPDPAVMAADRSISAGDQTLPVRIFTPKEGNGPWPVVVYYHGGGWVIANKEVYDAGARALSKMANAVVVSVDYRQGPEHKFPAAHDDAIAAYKWALANAASIKGDPKKIALAGESAGGGLVVATAIAARDQKLQMPTAVVSVYPIAGSDTTTPSYMENADAKPLNRPMMSWFFDKYLRSPADRDDPRINLVDADLKGLPPTTIINAQLDPLRSEGEMLAERMRAAGVDVQQKTYSGVTHEFFGMGAVVDAAKEAEQMAADALKKSFR